MNLSDFEILELKLDVVVAKSHSLTHMYSEVEVSQYYRFDQNNSNFVISHYKMILL